MIAVWSPGARPGTGVCVPETVAGWCGLGVLRRKARPPRPILHCRSTLETNLRQLGSQMSDTAASASRARRRSSAMTMRASSTRMTPAFFRLPSWRLTFARARPR